MKNIVFLFFIIYSWIVSFKENNEVKILIADNNDIIEVFKENASNNCKKIKLGKRYSLKIIPVSDLIQHGVESPNEYILNDSTIITYNHYYTLEKNQNICIIK